MMAAQNPHVSIYPGWFNEFLADRAIRKPSPHTLKAYRQDFEATAILVADTPEELPCVQPTDRTDQGQSSHGVRCLR